MNPGMSYCLKCNDIITLNDYTQCKVDTQQGSGRHCHRRCLPRQTDNKLPTLRETSGYGSSPAAHKRVADLKNTTIAASSESLHTRPDRQAATVGSGHSSLPYYSTRSYVPGAEAHSGLPDTHYTGRHLPKRAETSESAMYYSLTDMRVPGEKTVNQRSTDRAETVRTLQDRLESLERTAANKLQNICEDTLHTNMDSIKRLIRRMDPQKLAQGSDLSHQACELKTYISNLRVGGWEIINVHKDFQRQQVQLINEFKQRYGYEFHPVAPEDPPFKQYLENRQEAELMGDRCMTIYRLIAEADDLPLQQKPQPLATETDLEYALRLSEYEELVKQYKALLGLKQDELTRLQQKILATSPDTTASPPTVSGDDETTLRRWQDAAPHSDRCRWEVDDYPDSHRSPVEPQTSPSFFTHRQTTYPLLTPAEKAHETMETKLRQLEEDTSNELKSLHAIYIQDNMEKAKELIITLPPDLKRHEYRHNTRAYIGQIIRTLEEGNNQMQRRVYDHKMHTQKLKDEFKQTHRCHAKPAPVDKDLFISHYLEYNRNAISSMLRYLHNAKHLLSHSPAGAGQPQESEVIIMQCEFSDNHMINNFRNIEGQHVWSQHRT